MDKEESQDSNTSKALSKAITSVRSHPVRVSDLASLRQLKFFGPVVVKVRCPVHAAHRQDAPTVLTPCYGTAVCRDRFVDAVSTRAACAARAGGEGQAGPGRCRAGCSQEGRQRVTFSLASALRLPAGCLLTAEQRRKAEERKAKQQAERQAADLRSGVIGVAREEEDDEGACMLAAWPRCSASPRCNFQPPACMLSG